MGIALDVCSRCQGKRHETRTMSTAERDYDRCLLAMYQAAMEWLATHGAAELSFTLPPVECLPIGNLDGPRIDILAPGPVSREFLRHLDSATKGQATMLQACVVIRELKLPIDPQSESVWARALARGGRTS
jgi:hypothetical protein